MGNIRRARKYGSTNKSFQRTTMRVTGFFLCTSSSSNVLAGNIVEIFNVIFKIDRAMVDSHVPEPIYPAGSNAYSQLS